MKSGNFFKDLNEKKKRIAVVGLGYVGIPLFVSLSRHFRIIGFDIDEDKLKLIRDKKNIEEFPELKSLKSDGIALTSDEKELKKASFFIITVPTPIDNFNNPDLRHIKSSTSIVGRNMPGQSIIVFESTVYPGLTEEVCIPLLEKKSGLKNMDDFCAGYSPERINPGDRTHTLENIIKIISAQDKDTLDIIEKVYSRIIKAGLYKAESIKVAEAAKVIENIQRDLNIAFINELSMIFKKMDIDSHQVLRAARTKWNFLDFKPGLVGGHCIGVDPFYLTYKANEMGYNPEIILAGRRINENMSRYIGSEIIKHLLTNSHIEGKLDIAIFGFTFKENVKDIRNTKVIDLYNYLVEHGINVSVFDPVASKDEVYREYGIKMVDYKNINNLDAVVFCVAHDELKKIKLDELRSRFKNKPFIFDIKGIFDQINAVNLGFHYWRL